MSAVVNENNGGAAVVEDKKRQREAEEDPEASKKMKSSEDEKPPLANMSNVTDIEVLQEKTDTKSIFLHCKVAMPGGGDKDDALVILEKTPFNKDTIAEIISDGTRLTRNFQNDKYGQYMCYPPPEANGLKLTLICPATDTHIRKYSKQVLFLVEETSELYKLVTKPFIASQDLTHIQWVFNILEKKAEADRIAFEDPDPSTGFVMVPDLKWDQKQAENLYFTVISHDRSIQSLRDLNRRHLPLLRNILNESKKVVFEKFGIAPSKLRVYVHYQPSYYHFHVHVTHVALSAPGVNVERAHILSDIIGNIELVDDYYQRKTLTYILGDSHPLLAAFRASGHDPTASEKSE